jgi:hypothetical protein
MVRLGTVALDGTKLAGNAAERANRTLAKLEGEVAEILRQAAEADQREDREHGDARGDELPAALASKAGRLARLRQAKALLEAEVAARQRRYEQRVAALAAAARGKGKQPRARIKPRARDEAPKPEAVANVTDPDSRLVHTRKGSLQGYNAQAVTTLEQVVVAAELTQQANDLQQLGPMLDATAAALAHHRVKAAVGQRQPTGISDHKASAPVGELHPRVGQVACRRVEADHRGRVGRREHRLVERAGATAHIQPEGAIAHPSQARNS